METPSIYINCLANNMLALPGIRVGAYNLGKSLTLAFVLTKNFTDYAFTK